MCLTGTHGPTKPRATICAQSPFLCSEDEHKKQFKRLILKCGSVFSSACRGFGIHLTRSLHAVYQIEDGHTHLNTRQRARTTLTHPPHTHTHGLQRTEHRHTQGSTHPFLSLIKRKRKRERDSRIQDITFCEQFQEEEAQRKVCTMIAGFIDKLVVVPRGAVRQLWRKSDERHAARLQRVAPVVLTWMLPRVYTAACALDPVICRLAIYFNTANHL